MRAAPPQRLAPIGVPGELVVSGPQVTRGYLNLPDKTAAVFAPNPYCLGPGSCTDVMYRTGDLARWLPDGRLECLGRTDHQVGGHWGWTHALHTVLRLEKKH